MPPKVFVSHASDDKARFVIPFATRLRAAGVDAWVDKWEILPGDSLVDKIFEEGLKEAAAVIVVVSANSVQKPWVREELNAAVVKRIEKGAKVIPVVIDDVEVPEALRTVLWVRIKDLNAYDESFDRIVSAIFGVTDKPPLGVAPPHVQHVAARVGTLSPLDSRVLIMACENAMKTEQDAIDIDQVYMVDGSYVIPESELEDAIEILQRAGYVQQIPYLHAGPKPFQITLAGFEAYCGACLPEYTKIVHEIALALVNKGLQSSDDVAAEVGQGRRLVNHVLQVLAVNQHIQLFDGISHNKHIVQVSASLRRALAS